MTRNIRQPYLKHQYYNSSLCCQNLYSNLRQWWLCYFWKKTYFSDISQKELDSPYWVQKYKWLSFLFPILSYPAIMDYWHFCRISHVKCIGTCWTRCSQEMSIMRQSLKNRKLFFSISKTAATSLSVKSHQSFKILIISLSLVMLRMFSDSFEAWSTL